MCHAQKVSLSIYFCGAILSHESLHRRRRSALLLESPRYSPFPILAHQKGNSCPFWDDFPKSMPKFRSKLRICPQARRSQYTAQNNETTSAGKTAKRYPVSIVALDWDVEM